MVTLNGATLDGATLNGATLNGATLNGGTLNGVTLNGVTVNGATTNGATTTGVATHGTMTNGASTNGATLNGDSKPGAHRIVLFTHARSASNLLTRVLLSKQDKSKLSFEEYHFTTHIMGHIGALEAARHDEAKWKEAWDKLWREYYVVGSERFQNHFAEAERKGMIAFEKEHVFFAMRPEFHFVKGAMPDPYHGPIFPKTAEGSTSCTVLPDDFLKTVTPIFLIRHPALCMPSWERVLADNPGASFQGANHIPGKWLYQWYEQLDRSDAATAPPNPIVLAAEDYMTSPSVLKQICAITGLDPDKVTLEWGSGQYDKDMTKFPEGAKVMLTTLTDSTGIMAEKSGKGIKVEDEIAKWRKEFSPEVAKRMEEVLAREMDAYSYMYERRLMPEDT